MRVLVTGAGGFVGKNLVVRLREHQGTAVTEFRRGDDADDLHRLVAETDAVVHLAGTNRPSDEEDFTVVNSGLTAALCAAVRAAGKNVPIIFSSSSQADLDNPYGRSKLTAEKALAKIASETGNGVVIYRLPGVFGKWCRPDYNSVVATFCHNIARNLPIRINDPSVNLRLVYVDDVVSEIVTALRAPPTGLHWGEVKPEYEITVGALAEQIAAFRDGRSSLVTDRVGTGLTRALYSTYVSYLPTKSFEYTVPKHVDMRGVFVEMLKTPDCGQFSYFTAHPGVTRGGHYHHSKTEKFLVIKGRARFRFRNIVTNEAHELVTTGDHPTVVDTVPGWTHDITNVGDDELIVMLWANEIFDRARPDTIPCKV